MGLFSLPLSSHGQGFPILRFQKFYGRGGNDTPTCLEKTLDGNLLLGGNVAENDGKGGCTNIWIIKVDEFGDQIWEREFGGSGCDELRDMVVTPDSGVIFVGITSSFIEHPEKGEEDYQGDFFMGKLNKLGEIEWLKTYGGLDVDQAYGVASARKGEYMVVGATNSSNFDVQTELLMTNMWAVRVSDFGKKDMAQAYGGNKQDWAFSVAGTNEGEYIFAGFTNSEDLDGTSRRSNGDAWVGKIDRYGSLRWQQVFSGKFEDYFAKVIVDPTGRLVCVGNFETEEQGKQFWFLKLTGEGKKMYEQIFGGNENEFATSVDALKLGGYIMTGFSRYYNLENEYIKGGEDFWLIRLDARGNILWKQTYGGRDNERGVDVIEFDNGVFFALGVKHNDFEANGTKDKKDDFWLLKVEETDCDEFAVRIENNLGDFTINRDKYFKLRARAEQGDSYLWDFGDGTISRDKDPVHRYDNPGVYQVKLTVFLNENCTQSAVLEDYIIVW